MPSSIASVRSATASRRARSCDTSKTVAGKFSSAASSASRISRSRWFVGSSRTRKFAPGRDDDRQRQPPPLAAGEHAHRLLVRLPAGEEEPPEQVLRLGAPQPGHRLHALEHRAALVELGLVLREVRRHDAVADPDALAPAAEERLEQRRLPGAVRADERDVLAALDRERDVVEQVLLACRQRQLLDLGDHLPAARRVQELEAEPLRAAREQRQLVGGDRLLLLAAARCA